MSRIWWSYLVSEVSMDQLWYERAYVRDIPEQTEFAKRYDDITRYVGGTVYSANSPLVNRWDSFGISVKEVVRVPKPKGSMWTAKTLSPMTVLEWVEEML